MQEKLQTTREGLDKYTDTKPSVIKKKAGRRPVLPVQKKNQTTREGSDKHTDAKPGVIKKELAESQL